MTKLLQGALFTLFVSTVWLSGQEAVDRQTGDVQAADPMQAVVHRPSYFESFSREKGTGPTFEEQVVALVNIERLNNGGLPPLKQNSLLDQSSETHSENMAVRDFFAHCDLDTRSSMGDRMTAAGYAWNSAGENIAAGQTTPEAVMTAWMNSSGHRANILRTSFQEIGVGYFFQSADQNNVRFDDTGDCNANRTGGPFRHYWTQNFGRSGAIFPLVINREAYVTEVQTVDLYIYGQGTFSEMRFRNNSGAFSEWEPFATEKTWNLDFGNGMHRVTVELRRPGGATQQASDTIVLELPCVTEAFWYQQVEDWQISNNLTVLDFIAMRDNFCSP
ncbi:CAP domain-containing protein [Acanthopleuribacter pedis]|uniref:SCP domain-containing protein n=1 Tax=Acanthopleuribacter pedis TaxID=442870 RepID=A0A8J7U8X5_9BACT|nr:CAP domain-containing protein [Acanthopleuribacter pedis]MBO1323046.1 hypothetical protein [Acanthopleuribacter pedis]